MNEIIYKPDKFMPEMHLRQPKFTYSACGTFTKNKEGIKKIKETGYSRLLIKTKKTKLVFNMIWIMEILKV